MMKIKKILIANRGEIAVRIIRTCRDLNIATVSVHSTEDENSLHVKMSDESVCIGGPRPDQSYLNIKAILSAAEITGADAIHPGFGLLSENANFADACHQWGINFIGPSSTHIKKLGDKIYSKQVAKDSGIPVLEALTVNGRSEQDILADVKALGLPVLIKASAGGGGRGMQKITDFDDLFRVIEKLKVESKASFGDDTLFIEKYIENPRHVEVQILADSHGHCLHLGERDCTVQRRYQKLIEESPCSLLAPKKRTQVCKLAVDLAAFVGYDSVGTVEFLYDQDDQKFYFMEMNTRIQVEHPVTEERTGIDLIKQMIHVAEGNPLAFTQADVEFTGHAIECRINAENPYTNRPAPGLIKYYHRPGGIGVRVDDYVYSGYKVSAFYDSMIAKIIVKGKDREECLDRLNRALLESVIHGIDTNISLHQQIIKDQNFRGNNYSTNFLDQFLK